MNQFVYVLHVEMGRARARDRKAGVRREGPVERGELRVRKSARGSANMNHGVRGEKMQPDVRMSPWRDPHRRLISVMLMA